MSHRMKPLDTRYKGYRFRSRLEARWAVFFDSLGIAWEYEREGYTFREYAYLPDFWIPKWNMFVEIKSEKPSDDELRKYRAFADESQSQGLLLIYGGISPERYQIAWFRAPVMDEPLIIDEGHFAECRKECGEIFLLSDSQGAWALARNESTDCPCDSWPLPGSALNRAFEAALSKRFEFEQAERGNAV